MKFNVQFVDSWFTRHRIPMRGNAVIHLQELGLIVEGARAKYYLPIHIPLLAGLVHDIMADNSFVTIPYSRICHYKRPALFHGDHDVTVQMDSDRMRLSFKVYSDPEVFAERLQEYMDIAKTFQVKGSPRE